MVRSMVCTTSGPDCVRVSVPLISPGLPGIVTCMSADDGDDQVSSCTKRISSPTSLRAKPGIRSVPWACSRRTAIPGPSGVISQAKSTTCW